MSSAVRATPIGPLERTTASRMLTLLQLARPHQWIKNGLVLMPLLFSHSLANTEAAIQAVWAFAAFCLASSATYVINDLCDVREDRNHPVKRARPLASGQIRTSAAMAFTVVLILAAISAAATLPSSFQVVLGGYFALTLAYSFGLKRVVILDVMIVSLGFVARAVGGSCAIGVLSTSWLVLCTFMLALMVSFGKRRHELMLLGDSAKTHRRTLREYSKQILDTLIGICGSAAVMTYALYTMSPDTVKRFGSHNLLLTMPFVLFGLFRYVYLLYSRSEGDPARLFGKDPATVINAILWCVAAALVIYGPLRGDAF